MSIETLQKEYHVEDYVVDQDGYGRFRSEAEKAAIRRDMRLKDILDYSTLAADDIQHLRAISAEYAMVCASLPDNANHRTVARDYLLSDLPVVTEHNTDGLRQDLDPEQGAVVTIDGTVLTTEEFESIYAVIEPSRESLDRAVEDSAYFYTPSIDEEPKVEVEQSDANPQTVTHVPIPDEAYSLREGMRPITEQLRRHIGGKVISLFNAHRGTENKKHHPQHHIKIAS